MNKKKVKSFDVLYFISVIAVELTIACLGVTGIVLFRNAWALKDITAQMVSDKAVEAMSKYEYALHVLDVNVTEANSTSKTYEYILSSEKDSTMKSYTYLDSDGAELNQRWYYDEENENYAIYIYDSKYNVWVKTSNPTEPVGGTPWTVFSNLGNYSLFTEKQKWYHTDDMCYVLETVSQSDKYAVIYEQVFIRAEDFLPIGIVTYAVSDVNEDKLRKGESVNFNVGDDTYNVTEEIPTYDECIQMYEVSFSHEDMSVVEVPESYLTEEEYIQYIDEGVLYNE